MNILWLTFGKQSLRTAIVFRWYNKFKRGRQSLEVETHSSQPITTSAIQNAETLRKLIKEEARITV